jgi:hypothetical protein
VSANSKYKSRDNDARSYEIGHREVSIYSARNSVYEYEATCLLDFYFYFLMYGTNDENEGGAENPSGRGPKLSANPHSRNASGI